jgi:hypothetical protein
LNSDFEIEDLGVVKKILGMEIHKDHQVRNISQSQCIKKILEYFSIEKINATRKK